jgi:hypothetical protein
MGKGYAEGPAIEEMLTEHQPQGPERHTRQAVYGSTDAEPQRHFIGWIEEVNPEQLFAAGEAWGLSVVSRAMNQS